MDSERRGALLALVGQYLFNFRHSDGREPAGDVIWKHINRNVSSRSDLGHGTTMMT